jgi:hypothetical protein
MSHSFESYTVWFQGFHPITSTIIAKNERVAATKFYYISLKQLTLEYLFDENVIICVNSENNKYQVFPRLKAEKYLI